LSFLSRRPRRPVVPEDEGRQNRHQYHKPGRGTHDHLFALRAKFACLRVDALYRPSGAASTFRAKACTPMPARLAFAVNRPSRDFLILIAMRHPTSWTVVLNAQAGGAPSAQL